MDWFDTSPSASATSQTSPRSSPPDEGSERDVVGSMALEMTGRLLCAVVTCVFAVVGSLVGSVTGALLGLATESGFFRGAGIGAISGAVFSIESVEPCLALWRSNGPGIWSVLYVIDIIASLLSGRLVREKVGPAVQSAVQSQMSAVESPLREAFDLFETGSAKGLSKDLVDKLPMITITEEESNVDAAGERLCCSVCLQDFHGGEAARILANCRHIYHLTCIDSWLTRHASCPLCRRDV